MVNSRENHQLKTTSNKPRITVSHPVVIEKGKHVGTLEKDSIVNVVANSSVEK